jgi:hypothetical protein
MLMNSLHGMVLLSLDFFVKIKNIAVIHEKLFYSKAWHAVLCFSVVNVITLTVIIMGVFYAGQPEMQHSNSTQQAAINCLLYRPEVVNPYATYVELYIFGAFYWSISCIFFIMAVKKGHSILLKRKIHPQVVNVTVIEVRPIEDSKIASSLQRFSIQNDRSTSKLETSSGSALLENSRRHNQKVNQFKRMTYLVLIILLLNTVTLVPYIMFYTLYRFNVNGAELGIQISAVMSMVNSSCNVFKYTVTDKMFRLQLKKILKCFK